MRSLVIDTDTASDDAVALMMALRHPEVVVEAISVVAGNVGIDQAVQNALYVVELCGVEVPVHAGAAMPLVQDLVTAQDVHGQDGMGDIGLPVRGRTPAAGSAVDVLINTFLDRPGEIDLVTLGPLTNVALALIRAPELAGAIRHCYIMGGTGGGYGNITPLAEYNFWADPEAAAIVVRAPKPKTIVGWDISVASATFSPEEAAALRSMGTPYARVAVDCQAVLDDYARDTGLAGFDLPDPIAMAVALDPSIASTADVHIKVLTGAGPDRGVQSIDWQGVGGPAPNARIVREVPRASFLAALRRALSQEGTTRPAMHASAGPPGPECPLPAGTAPDPDQPPSVVSSTSSTPSGGGTEGGLPQHEKSPSALTPHE